VEVLLASILELLVLGLVELELVFVLLAGGYVHLFDVFLEGFVLVVLWTYICEADEDIVQNKAVQDVCQVEVSDYQLFVSLAVGDVGMGDVEVRVLFQV
jgi:hypothetical protein